MLFPKYGSVVFFTAFRLRHHLYLIDFGLSKRPVCSRCNFFPTAVARAGRARYWDKKHVPSTQKLSLTGTARREIGSLELRSCVGRSRYASLNAHRGFEQSRRDDLEAEVQDRLGH